MRAVQMAKLTDDARSQAFQRLRAGDKQAHIARDLGVSRGTVSALAQQLHETRAWLGDEGAPCEMPEMAKAQETSEPADASRGPTCEADEAVLLSNLPDDGVVCDHDAGALRLSQVTGKSLS